MPSGYKWNSEGLLKYNEFQDSFECEDMFNGLVNKIFAYNQSGSQLFSDEFTKIIHTMAASSLTCKRIPKTVPKKKWFDSDCKNSKKNLNRLARNCSSHPFCPEIRNTYHKERNSHNRLMKHKRLDFLSRLNASIENGHCLDWKKFKQLKQTNDNQVALDKLRIFY